MDFRDYLLLLARRWPLVLGSFLIVAGGLVAFSLTLKPTYAATSTVHVRIDVAKPNPNAIMDADIAVQGRTTSYAMLANSETVLDAVDRELNLHQGYARLNGAITTTVPDKSPVIEITAKAGSAPEAADIANAVAEQLPAAAAAMDGQASSTTSPTQFSVVQRALPPTGKVSPNLKLNTAIAIFAGLFVAVMVAVVAEMFEFKLRRREQIEATGTRFLGSLARPAHGTPHTLLAEGSAADVYQRLALDVLLGSGQPPVSIAVTAPVAEAGITSVAANLSTAFAAAGHRVLYIDLDGDGGRLAPLAGIPESHGITDVLAGTSDLDVALMYWERGGFSVLPIGSAHLNAAEMLGGRQFTGLLSVLTDLFDIVVVDAPPVLSAPETGLLLRSVPHTVLVAPARRTRINQLDNAVSAIGRSGSDLLGTVMTNDRTTIVPTRARREKDEFTPLEEML